MAFHDHEMSFESFADNDNREMQQRLSAAGGSVAPTWLSDAILRRNDEDDGDGDDDVVPGTMRLRGEGTDECEWEGTRRKAEIVAHPLYERMLAAHVACLRIATPVDQLPRIDTQLEQSRRVVGKYSLLRNGAVDEKELDQFMVNFSLFLLLEVFDFVRVRLLSLSDFHVW